MYKIITLIVLSFIYNIADAGEIFIVKEKNGSAVLTNKKPSNFSDEKLIKVSHHDDNSSIHHFLDTSSNFSDPKLRQVSSVNDNTTENSSDTKIPAKSETKKSIDLNLEKKVPDVQKKEKNTIKQKIDISSLL